MITFLKVNSRRERNSEYVADAPTVHRNPMMYFPLETFVVESESGWTARSEAETVSRTRELKIYAVNFWEFSTNEKSALKAN